MFDTNNTNKLNENDVEIMRAAVRSRRAENQRLFRFPPSGETEKRIRNNSLVIGAYDRLIKIREVGNYV